MNKKNLLKTAYIFICFTLLYSTAVANDANKISLDNVSYLKSSHLDKILANSELRVCFWPDYYSISYRSPKDYSWSGIDIELAQHLASNLGVNLKYIESDFTSLIDDVLNDKCDIAMFGIGVNEQRKKHLRFTSAYLFSDVLAVTTKTNRKIKNWEDVDKAGNVISIVENTIHEHIMKDYLKNASTIKSKYALKHEQDVESGRADAFIADFPYAIKMLKTTDWARLVLPESDIYITYYAWAMKPGDDKWYEYIEKFIKQIKSDNTLINTADKYGLKSMTVLE